MSDFLDTPDVTLMPNLSTVPTVSTGGLALTSQVPGALSLDNFWAKLTGSLSPVINLTPVPQVTPGVLLTQPNPNLRLTQPGNSNMLLLLALAAAALVALES